MNNVFWPREVKFSDIWVTTAWSFISWVIWSVILLFLVSIISVFIDIPWNFNNKMLASWWWNAIFSFILSFITFIASVVVSIITYNFFSLTDPNKYKKTIIHFWQISFFSIILYIFFSPIYIYAWIQDYDNIMTVFIVHSLLLSFWVTIILEVMNNYRYILLWIYASLIWLILSWIINFYIFSLFWWWYAKLISLLLILPLINWLTTFFKWVFEFLYYKYFIFTWLDQLWDIFKQIEQEELDELKETWNENATYY